MAISTAAEYYRAMAARMIDRATKSSFPEIKASLVEIAVRYEKLASGVEKHDRVLGGETLTEEATADTYRRYAKQARTEAEAATDPDLKRQWNEMAATYDRLVVSAEQAAMKRANP